MWWSGAGNHGFYHGIQPLKPGDHPVAGRFATTSRSAGQRTENKNKIILDVCERQFTLLADFSCPDCSACNYFFLSGGSIAGLLSR